MPAEERKFFGFLLCFAVGYVLANIIPLGLAWSDAVEEGGAVLATLVAFLHSMARLPIPGAPPVALATLDLVPVPAPVQRALLVGRRPRRVAAADLWGARSHARVGRAMLPAFFPLELVQRQMDAFLLAHVHERLVQRQGGNP